jgi:hypothetical protein
MAALTYQFKDMRLSLAHQTVTIYPRDIDNIDDYLTYIGTLKLTHALKSTIRYVKYEDKDHSNYHDDIYDRKDEHIHIQFNCALDEAKLDLILNMFIDLSVISQTEKNEFFIQYRKVKQLWNKSVEAPFELLRAKQREFKSKALIDPQYNSPANACAEVILQIEQYVREYGVNKTPDTYNTLMSKCNDAINEAHQVLDVHRGCKEILLNVLVGVLTFGAAFLVNLAVSGGRHGFFHFKTDSEDKLDLLQSAQHKIVRI